MEWISFADGNQALIRVPTDERARRRAARLEAETGPDSSHWTVQSYFDDVHELERLRGFTGD
jgi:hypothetical protein